MDIKISVSADFEASPENILAFQTMVAQMVQETPEIQKRISCSGTGFSCHSPLGYLTIRNRAEAHGPVENFGSANSAGKMEFKGISSEDIKVYLPSTEEPEEVVHSNTVLYSTLHLPHVLLQTTWDNIILPDTVKTQLRQLVRASKRLSSHMVDPNIVSMHKMLLLHSVPGCGKTSIAIALAQELSVDLAPPGAIITNTSLLITVNAHALFSKWFSESGKIITRLFTSIAEEASDNKEIYLLIDEIESLAGNRERAISAGEPSDMIRAANAMLTQLDQLKRFSNVYVLCTTNLIDTLDPAFVDRCDAVINLTLPGDTARQLILEGVISELLDKQVLTSLLHVDAAAHPFTVTSSTCSLGTDGKPCQRCHQCLEHITLQTLFKTIITSSSGLSGRQLRKLPYTALSLCSDDDFSLVAFLRSFISLLKDRQK